MFPSSSSQCVNNTVQYQQQPCQPSCYTETVTRETAPSTTQLGVSDVVNWAGSGALTNFLKNPNVTSVIKSLLTAGADIAKEVIEDEIRHRKNPYNVGQGTMYAGPPGYYGPPVYGPPVSYGPRGYLPGDGGYPPYQQPYQYPPPNQYYQQNPPNQPQNPVNQQQKPPNQPQNPANQPQNPANQPQSPVNQQKNPTNQPQNPVTQQQSPANQPPNQYQPQNPYQPQYPMNQYQSGIPSNQYQPQNQNNPQNQTNQPSSPAPTKSAYVARMNRGMVPQKIAYERLDDETSIKEVELVLKEVITLLQLLERSIY